MQAQYERIAELIYRKYSVRPDFPWKEFPAYEVFRHRENRKWFGLIMNIPPDKLHHKIGEEKLSLPETVRDMKEIYIIDLKLPQAEIPSLEKTSGIFPAYHMDAKYWISALLEDILTDDFIMSLVEKSYNITLNER